MARVWDRPVPPGPGAGAGHRQAEQGGAAAWAGSLSAAVPRGEGGQGPPRGLVRATGAALFASWHPTVPPGRIWLTSDGRMRRGLGKRHEEQPWALAQPSSPHVQAKPLCSPAQPSSLVCHCCFVPEQHWGMRGDMETFTHSATQTPCRCCRGLRSIPAIQTSQPLCF